MDSLVADDGGFTPKSGRISRKARSFKVDVLDRLNSIKVNAVRAQSPAKQLKKSDGVLNHPDTSSERSHSLTNGDVAAVCREVEFTIKYYRDVVDKGMLDMLAGSTTAVLEAVLRLHVLLKNHVGGCTNSHISGAFESRTGQLHVALAGLVQWSNTVLLQRILEDPGQLPPLQSPQDVISTVQHAATSLATLACAVQPLSAVRRAGCGGGGTARTVDRADHRGGRPLHNGTATTPAGLSHRNSLPDLSAQLLTPTNSSTAAAAGSGGASLSLSSEILSSRDVRSGSCTAGQQYRYPSVPPTPPHTANRSLTVDGSYDVVPPPLPPKSRQKKPPVYVSSPANSSNRSQTNSSHRSSWSDQNQRRGSTSSQGRRRGGSVSGQGSSSRLSPASSLDSVLNQSQDGSDVWNKRGSYSSAGNSSASSCRESDGSALPAPADAQQPPLVALDEYGNWSTAAAPADITALTRRLREMSGLAAPPAADHAVTLSVPPALPPKRRRGTAEGCYDNVPGRRPALPERCPAVPTSYSLDGVVLRYPDRYIRALDAADDDDAAGGLPPPLPAKKKHVQSYMEMLGDYRQPSHTEFLRQSAITYQTYAARWSRLEYSSQRSLTVAGHTRSSSEESADTDLFLHRPLVEELSPPPALPPKRRVPGGGCNDAIPEHVFTFPSSQQQQQQQLVLTPPSTPTPPVPPLPPPHGTAPGDQHTYHRPTLNHSPPQPADADGSPLKFLEAEQLLVFKQTHEEGPDLRGGPIDALVTYATKASRNDFVYQEAFLTTYRTFLLPETLLEKLLQRYDGFHQCQDGQFQRAAKNAFSLLVRVVDELAITDLTGALLQRLMEFEVSLLTNGDLSLAKALRCKLLEKYEARRRHDNPLPDLPAIADDPRISPRLYSLVDFKSEQLAGQMTLLDSRLFVKIEISEMLLWAQEQKEERSPNLTTFTEHFNKMSYWARTLILTAPDARERERLLLKFVKIMKHLRKLNNFNSFLALLSALDSAPIRRLEWQKQTMETLKEYCCLIDPSSSFRAYRQALAESSPPCIPYIGLILQDLTFVHIGNPDLLNDGSVNFAKRWQQFNILDIMKRFKKQLYCIKPVDKIIGFFSDFDHYISEEDMWTISETIKPRGRSKK